MTLWAAAGQYRQMVAEEFAEPGKTTAIIGCGDLPINHWRLAKGSIRLDINPKATGLQILADGQYLPLKSSSCDVIIAMEVIEHVLKPYKLLDEIQRVLKPEGTLVLSTPNTAHLLSRLALLTGAFIEDRTLHHDDIDHLHFFDSKFLERVLKSRFHVVVTAHRFITLPGFRYFRFPFFRNLCFQAMFLASGGKS